MTTIKKKLNRNGTKKCRPRQNELKVLCQQHANTFNQFEEEYEKNFKDSLKEENDNIEDKLVKLGARKIDENNFKIQIIDNYYDNFNSYALLLNDYLLRLRNKNNELHLSIYSISG